ncbi:addiction module antidote protein [Bdellovibrio sp. HCB290]|uniref:addiction module antidote protein n=1 Tax=Bdellovibrio sp. HCB290 TaxID=3394356 RepID=UPI0039B3F66D
MKKTKTAKKSSKKKVSPIGSDFSEHLELELTNPESAAEYINAAVEMNDPEYLKVALGRVARARGVAQISNATKIRRESIYKLFLKEANPGLASIQQILSACGLELVVRSKRSNKKVAS